MNMIAKDARGESWSLLLPNGQELVIIYTKKGFYRGGHSHDKPETSFLLSGSIRYLKRYPDGREEVFDHAAGEPLHNEPGEIHLALALDDYWLLDTRTAKAGEIKTTNYEPYRKKVEEQLKKKQSL